MKIIEYYKKIIEKYNGIYILTGEKKKINSVWYIEVMCPHCKRTRFIRKTLLNNTNKNKQISTLCRSCVSKTERLFKQTKNGIWFTVINQKIMYIDEDDIDRIKNLNLQITYKESEYPYVHIRLSAKYTIPLHRYLLGLSDDKLLVDHINHNTLDNRKDNLRLTTKSGNMINSRISTDNKSGFKNISICDRQQKWFVQFKYCGKRITKRFYKFIDAYTYLKNSNEYNSEFLYKCLDDKNIILRYAGIEQDELKNGEYIGETIFTQFCTHKCIGCHNPQTWSKDGGYVFSKNTMNNILLYFQKAPYANRLTLSGGDPFDNLVLSNLIAAEFKFLYPEKKLWIYTGYTYETLIKSNSNFALLDMCDVLVDGEYIKELRDITLPYRGSSNQRIIDMNSTLKEGRLCMWKTL